MSFEAKYLKYKKKYLELKYLIEYLEENKNNSITQKGGGLPCILNLTERCKKIKENKRALKRALKRERSVETSVENPIYATAEEALRKAKEASSDALRRIPEVPRAANPIYDKSFYREFDPESEIYGIPGKREGYPTKAEAYTASMGSRTRMPEVPLAANPIYDKSFDPEREIYGIPGKREGYPTKSEAYAAYDPSENIETGIYSIPGERGAYPTRFDAIKAKKLEDKIQYYRSKPQYKTPPQYMEPPDF